MSIEVLAHAAGATASEFCAVAAGRSGASGDFAARSGRGAELSSY